MTRSHVVVTARRSANCMISTPFRYERVEHEREHPVSARGAARTERARPRRRGGIVLVASLGHYTRKAHVSGYLSPDEGLIKIYAPVTGVVIDKRVTEGQTVQAGEPLFVLSTDHGSPEAPAAQAAAIASLTQRRDSLRTALHNQDEIDRNTQRRLQEHLQGLEQEIAQVDAAARTQAQRLASAEETATRFRELAAM